MSFKDTQSYKELQADWRWIHSMDPEAAAAADQWVKEHPEEWKELEHMLYYSEANFHKRVAPDTVEDVDIKQPLSYNPEAFLPEEVRNAIYDDMRWFDRAKYLPEGSDEDPLLLTIVRGTPVAWVISSNDSAVPSFVFAYAWNSLISSSYDEHGSLKVSAIFYSSNSFI